MLRSLRTFAVVLAACSALALAALPSPAVATTVVRLADAQMAAESDLVVLVSVVEQAPRRADDGLLYTDTHVRIDEVLLGGTAAPGETLVVRQLGGRDGDETLVVPGDARLVPGEKAVLFLADRTPQLEVVYLTALGQSKLTVIGSTAEGDALLARDLQGLTFYDPAASEPLFTLDEVEILTLAALRARLEEVAP